MTEESLIGRDCDLTRESGHSDLFGIRVELAQAKTLSDKSFLLLVSWEYSLALLWAVYSSGYVFAHF